MIGPFNENEFQSRSLQASSRNHIQQKIKKKRHILFCFNNNSVSKVNSQIHLGAILDVKLTFEEHMKNVFKKTNKTIGLLPKLSNLLPRQAFSLFTKHLLGLI